MTSRLKGFKAPKRSTKIGGIGRAKRFNTIDTTDPEAKQLSYRLCGPRDKAIKIAKYHLSLKAQYPRITLPESITHMLLTFRKEQFNFQHSQGGGRTRYGGFVIDFWLPVYAVIIRTQGDYWHSLAGSREREIQARTVLQNAIIDGRPVSAVVDVWENALLDCNRKRIIDLAIAGIQASSPKF